MQNLEYGIEVELIDYSMKKEIEHYHIKIDSFFIKHSINNIKWLEEKNGKCIYVDFRNKKRFWLERPCRNANI